VVLCCIERVQYVVESGGHPKLLSALVCNDCT
jgi:hypothetical protein